MNSKNNKRSMETMQKIEDAFVTLLQARSGSTEDYAWIFTCIKEHPQHFNAYFKLSIREVKADYKTLFLRSAVHGVAKLWFEGGCVESEGAMGALIAHEIKID